MTLTRAAGGQRTGFWILFATILASSMAFIDSSALNVALPAIQNDLGASGAEMLWIVNAYALFLAALILVGGALGDRFGRKRVFMLGIILFTTASLACGLAPNSLTLIIARAFKGIGGALMVPGSLALISANFSAGKRGRAIGIWSSASTVTTLIGPLLGGYLASQGLWRFIFFINVPIAAAALAALLLRVPESRDEAAPPQLDYAGAILVTLGLAGLTYGFIEASERSWSDPLIIFSLAGGVLALAAFAFVEWRSPDAMVPPRLFRSRTFTGANLLTLLLYAALYGVLFFFPLNLIQVQGYNETLAGAASLPAIILLTVLSPWAGGLVDRYGPRLPLTVGPAVAGVGFALFARPGITGSPAEYWTSYFPAAIVLGLGMAVTVAPLTTSVMGSVGERFAGTASGVNNAVSRVAGVLAVAILGAVMLASFAGNLEMRTADLSLPSPAREALEREAANLGAATPPAGLDPAQEQAVAAAIDASFVAGFRLVALICAGLAWASALIAGLLVANRLDTPEEE